jgi:hypothetical protein
MRRTIDVSGALRRALRLVLTLALVGGASSRVDAAGPLFVSDAGLPLVWNVRPVPWNSDRGGLGILDQTSAHQLVADGFSVWAAVPTANIAFADAGTLPIDVTAATVGLFVGVCGDDLSPIVFDTDGTITDALFGGGASNSILGFAGPECGTFAPPVITEASAVLNGKFIDGIASGGNPEGIARYFLGVMVHEFGHYVNLDHSQINLSEAFDGQTLGDDAIATMFPFIVSGAETATLTRDDAVSLSTLYPADDFATTTGTITGEIRRGDSNAPFGGAFVIARNVDDPRRDAVGIVSGALYVAGSTAPGASARIGATGCPVSRPTRRTRSRSRRSRRSSRAARRSGRSARPSRCPGRGVLERRRTRAGTSPPDDPSAPGSAFPTAAGLVTSGVDVVLNVTPPPPNDACAAAASITTFPFTTTTRRRGSRPAPRRSDPRTASSRRAPRPRRASGSVSSRRSPARSRCRRTQQLRHRARRAYGLCGTLASVWLRRRRRRRARLGAHPPRRGRHAVSRRGDRLRLHGGHARAHGDVRPGAPGRVSRSGARRMHPGTGAPRTDCVTEWLVQPVPPLTSARVARATSRAIASPAPTATRAATSTA